MVAKKKEIDQNKVNQTINSYSAISSGTGFIPIPILDIAAVTGVQVLMVRDIAYLYQVDFNPKLAKPAISLLLSNITTIPLAGITGSLLKIVPGVGSILGGLSMFAFYSASTYALGKVFAGHFEQGGTLEDFDAKAFKEQFVQIFKKKSSEEEQKAKPAKAS